jgi:hypothetical protein
VKLKTNIKDEKTIECNPIPKIKSLIISTKCDELRVMILSGKSLTINI